MHCVRFVFTRQRARAITRAQSYAHITSNLFKSTLGSVRTQSHAGPFAVILLRRRKLSAIASIDVRASKDHHYPTTITITPFALCCARSVASQVVRASAPSERARVRNLMSPNELYRAQFLRRHAEVIRVCARTCCFRPRARARVSSHMGVS